MNGQRHVRCRAWTYAVCCLVTSFAAAALAEDEPLPAPRGGLPAHRIVVRFSDALFNSLMAGGIDRETTVHDNILGTSVYGRARIVAQPAVKLADCPDQATFQLVGEGTAYSRSTGYNRQAVIYSHTVTSFRATKQVTFDPGRGFYSDPPQVVARAHTTIDGTGSLRGGIIGQIVRRRAAREADALRPQAEEIARQKAELRIAAAIDRYVEPRLARLNRAAEIRALVVSVLRPLGSPEPNYACCSTPQHLQIATHFGEGGPAIELPVKGPASQAAAPIEVWVHRSLIGEPLGAALELLNDKARVSDLLVAARSAARNVDRRSSDGQWGDLWPMEWPVKLVQMRDWFVVELDYRADDRLDIARAPVARAPVAQPTENSLSPPGRGRQPPEPRRPAQTTENSLPPWHRPVGGDIAAGSIPAARISR